MIFLDTSFLLALHIKTDQMQPRALELAPDLKGETTVISSHNLEEVATFIAHRGGAGMAAKVARSILDSEETELVIPDREQLESALALLEKHEGLSLCDVLAVIIMKEKGIRRIASFDKDFDRFPGIRRLH